MSKPKLMLMLALVIVAAALVSCRPTATAAAHGLDNGTVGSVLH